MGEDQEWEIVCEAIGTVSPYASMYRGSKEREVRRDRKKWDGEEGLVLRKGPDPFGSRERAGAHQPILHMMPSTDSTRLQHAASRGGPTAEADLKAHAHLLL